MENRILRVREVCLMTGLSRTTLWRLEKVGMFPKRMKLARQAVGWSWNQITKWLSSKDENNYQEGVVQNG